VFTARFVSDKEVEDIVSFLKTQGVPEYLDAITEDDDESEGGGGGPAGTSNLADSDDPYDQAVAIVLRDGKASTSYIQRRLGIGYNRAASLIERMENEGRDQSRQPRRQARNPGADGRRDRSALAGASAQAARHTGAAVLGETEAKNKRRQRCRSRAFQQR
jgi:DNA segregation ATPase FtsK/SpoIIIE-like protein